MRHRLLGESGQAMTETMLVMGFLMLMVMGTITLCLLMTTKQVADYAAFGAARTSLTHGFQQAGVSFSGLFASIGLNIDSELVFDVPMEISAQTGWPSAAQVIYHTQKWWGSNVKNLPRPLLIDQPEVDGPQYVVVPFQVPYGMPIFNELPAGGLLILGRSQITSQPASLIWSPFDDD